jgi:hypothetical protein
MINKKLKNISGILSLLSSFIFIGLSLFSFLAMMLMIIPGEYDYFSFIVFFFALYYLIISIIMLTKFKTRRKLIKVSFRSIIANIINIAWFILLIIKFALMPESDSNMAEILALIMYLSSGFIMVIFSLISIILSITSVILTIIFLKPHLIKEGREIKNYIIEKKEDVKKDINVVRSYHQGDFNYLEEEVSNKNEGMFSDDTKYKIYFAAKKLYNDKDYNSALKYFNKIPNFKDSYKYIIEIEMKLNDNLTNNKL